MQHDIQRYLKPGPQTNVTEKLGALFPRISIRHLEDIFPLLDFLHNNIRFDETKKTKLFRRRSVKEIFSNGFATGCTDYALAFLPLARHNGVPARYVETIRNRWLELGNHDQLEGHVFVEIFLNGNWYVVDPQEKIIGVSYAHHKVIAKGLDSWDIGIRDFVTLKQKFIEFRKAIKSRR